jgi:hypothetical protein
MLHRSVSLWHRHRDALVGGFALAELPMAGES